MKIFLRILSISLIASAALAAIGAITATVVILWAAQDLPSFTRISDYRPPQVTTVFARDGSIIGYFCEERRFLVNLGEMQPALWQAFLAAEDADFYSHVGVSPKALLRATYKSIIAGSMGAGGGGSTITQQLVKRLLLSPERRLLRKNKEIILASPELKKANPWVYIPDYHNFFNAPTVIIISGEKKNPWHVCDCSLAIENMSLAAWTLSIGSCIVASVRFVFEEQAFLEKLGLPEGYIPLNTLSLGYIEGDIPLMPERKTDCINYLK